MNVFLFGLQSILIASKQDGLYEETSMRVTLRFAFLFFAALPVWVTAQGIAQDSSVKLIKTVELPGYSGDFDHFAADYDRDRLLLAAEDHGTLEVFDLRTSAHLRTIAGFGNPHSILVRKGVSTVFITDSTPRNATIRDAATYVKKQTVTLTPGSDTAKYDAAANILYVVTGGKDVDMKMCNLEAINPDTGAKLGSITFQDNHVEAMAFVDGDPRIFINLAQTNKIAVVNRKSMKVVATWPVPPAQQNAMVAFDPAQHRLYVVTRTPGMVVVMNSDTGAVVGAKPAPLRADEVQYDQAAHRLYVPGGEGYMSIYDTSDSDHLKIVEKVTTSPGAKTALLIPSMHRLFLAASPGDTKAMAKVLTYEVH
jgi:DNA-binding beta-propeller fold protein YncE